MTRITWQISPELGEARIIGKLVAGAVHAVDVINKDGDWAEGTYELKIKGRKDFTGDPWAWVQESTQDGDTLTFSLDLQQSAVLTACGDKPWAEAVIQITESSARIPYGYAVDVPIHNTTFRAGDLPPTPPTGWSDGESVERLGTSWIPVTYVKASDIEAHRTTEVHDQPQPPASHGNEAHDGDGFRPIGTDIPLDEVTTPGADHTISMANKTLRWLFTNPAGGMKWEFTGAATGHLLDIIQTGGNPGADMHLMHLEASDTDPLALHLVPGGATSRALKINIPGENMGPGRLVIDASGKLSLGDGTAVHDIVVERSAAGVWDVTLGTMKIGGVQVLTEGDVVDTLTSTETALPGSANQLRVLKNLNDLKTLQAIVMHSSGDARADGTYSRITPAEALALYDIGSSGWNWAFKTDDNLRIYGFDIGYNAVRLFHYNGATWDQVYVAPSGVGYSAPVINPFDEFSGTEPYPTMIGYTLGDALEEIVALQDGKEDADATILKEGDVVDTLTSTSVTAPLAAAQGKALGDRATVLESASRTPYTVPATAAIVMSGAGDARADGTYHAITPAEADALDDQGRTWAFATADETKIYGFSSTQLRLFIRVLDGTWSTAYTVAVDPDPGPTITPGFDFGTEPYPTMSWLAEIDPANGPHQSLTADDDTTIAVEADSATVQTAIMLDLADGGHEITLDATGIAWDDMIAIPDPVDGITTLMLHSPSGATDWQGWQLATRAGS
jgi:hypothetical protein